jgi:hypothetical protein|tara:strand:+ start:406 stop:1650 length:1245 start_codon:yes stop_codon:yes gene_type:complete
MNEPTITEWKTLIKRWKTKARTPHAYFDDLMTRPNMRRTYPISAAEVEEYKSFRTKSSEVDDINIISALEELGVENINLDTNIGYMVGDSKNPRKLGKILNQANFCEIYELLLKRNNNSNPSGNFAIVISAHPYDICRASYKRNWSSCLNPTSRYHFHDLLHGIVDGKKFNMIAYLVKEGDEKIQKPYGRTFIHPYKPSTGSSDKVKVFSLYDHNATVSLKSQNPKSYKNTPYVWDTSSGFFGRFPPYFRHKLSEIVNGEINAGHPHVNPDMTLSESPKFIGAYIDGNDYRLSHLRVYDKPEKKTLTSKPKPVINNTSNPSVNAVIEYNTFSSRWARNAFWVRYSQSAKNVYDILNNNTNRGSVALFDESRLTFVQIRNIIRKKPNILNHKYMRDYFRNRGAHFAKLVENNYTP